MKEMKKEEITHKQKWCIGRFIKVKGFNEPRTLKIVRHYFLGDNIKYPTFECIIMGDYTHFKAGERENFPAAAVIDSIVNHKMIKVLSA